MKKERNYSLDFLKIIATILIVFHHYQQILNVEFRGVNFFGLFWSSKIVTVTSN